ncbi:unnamed protein product [Boreogadus saida]
MWLRPWLCVRSFVCLSNIQDSYRYKEGWRRPTFGCYHSVAMTCDAQFHNLLCPLSKVTPTLHGDHPHLTIITNHAHLYIFPSHSTIRRQIVSYTYLVKLSSDLSSPF